MDVVTETKPKKPAAPGGSRAPAVIAVVALCFLAFVGGMFVAEFRTFPYSTVFDDAFDYLHAYRERKATEAEAVAEAKSAADPRVTVPATARAYDGYTFLTVAASHPSTAYLMDMNGKVVHEWHRPFREIWPKPPHKADPSPENAIAWRYAELQPNGDIITTIKAYGDTPDGYGIAKLDKDSFVLWSVAGNFHHHFSVAPDGRVFALVHEWRDTQQRPVPGLPPMVPPTRPALEDFVVELSPDGKELSRVSLLDAMSAPEFREYMRSAFAKDFGTKRWDPLHANDVEVIDEAFAARHPSLMRPGMVLVSLRDIDAIVLIDMKERRAVWALRGPWMRQHDPDLLPSGNILLFDNRGDNVKDGGSRIIEFDPISHRVVWSYAGTEQRPFYTDTAGGQERLPNGNTLIGEDNSGRLFEVAPDGETVWEYRGPRAYHAERVSKDWLKFEPGGPKSAAEG